MRKQIIAVVALWLSIVGIALAWNVADEKREHVEIAFEAGRAFFKQVVLTREWNATHEGVYVPVTETTQPNPYLEDPLRDLTADNGIRLTKINPAYMTRQIAEIAARESGIQFHITSLKPIRPENGATDWEKEWLESFENGVREKGEFVPAETGPVFRYMAPLLVTPSCLTCHENQGYHEGEIRGGISVTIPGIFGESTTVVWIGYGVAAVCGLAFIVVAGALLERKRQSLEEANEQLASEIEERRSAEERVSQQNTELKEALSRVKLLSGFLPICASCKKIRDDKGYWKQVELYIADHSEAEFSHGICPECARKIYPELHGE